LRSISDTLTADVSGSMLAPLVGVEPTTPSPLVTDTRWTVNAAAKRVDSSSITGTMNVYNRMIEHSNSLTTDGKPLTPTVAIWDKAFCASYTPG